MRVVGAFRSELVIVVQVEWFVSARIAHGQLSDFTLESIDYLVEPSGLCETSVGLGAHVGRVFEKTFHRLVRCFVVYAVFHVRFDYGLLQRRFAMTVRAALRQ